MDTNNAPRAPVGKREFLSFQLGGLAYGVDFHRVKELRSLGSLERVQADGSIVTGVAISRGVIMPIVDMRVACRAATATANTAVGTDVIILQLASCVIGMVVDGVTDVLRLDADQILPLPRAGSEGGGDYLVGLADAGGRRLILVDIDKLMSIGRGDEADDAGAQRAA